MKNALNAEKASSANPTSFVTNSMFILPSVSFQKIIPLRNLFSGRYQCPDCGKRLRSNTSLNRHRQSRLCIKAPMSVPYHPGCTPTIYGLVDPVRIRTKFSLISNKFFADNFFSQKKNIFFPLRFKNRFFTCL